MKIGIDCRLWSQSGVGRYTRNLVKNLQEIDRKNEYMLFVRSEDVNQLKFEIRNSKFEIVKVDIPWHSVSEQLLFPRILYKENLDLMHFPYFSVPILYRKPYVLTMHDLIVSRVSTGKASTLPFPIYKAKKIAYNFVVLQALKRAVKVVVPTNAVKNELVDHLHIQEDKIEVTYEGTFEKSEVRSKKSEVKLPDKNYFLYVGNAYPHKNLERLIEAFKKVLSSKYQVLSLKLILVGKEDLFYNRLKQKVLNVELKDSMYFLGEVSDDELVYLYKNAKALIVPSLIEGFGLTAVEAMSLECLVLASDIPALKEVCGDAAIYFNPYSVDELTSRIKEIYFNDLIHQSEYIKKGLERSKIFSWRKMAEQTARIYESCTSI